MYSVKNILFQQYPPTFTPLRLLQVNVQFLLLLKYPKPDLINTFTLDEKIK